MPGAREAGTSTSAGSRPRNPPDRSWREFGYRDRFPRGARWPGALRILTARPPGGARARALNRPQALGCGAAGVAIFGIPSPVRPMGWDQAWRRPGKKLVAVLRDSRRQRQLTWRPGKEPAAPWKFALALRSPGWMYPRRPRKPTNVGIDGRCSTLGAKAGDVFFREVIKSRPEAWPAGQNLARLRRALPGPRRARTWSADSFWFGPSTTTFSAGARGGCRACAS